MSKREIGQRAEEIAYAYLQQKGLTLITRNFHSRYGEIDLIMLDNTQEPVLCFIEVRARHVQSYLTAAESIGYAKQTKTIKTAQIYLAQYPEYENLFCRFDAFTLEYSQQNDLYQSFVQILCNPCIQLQWIQHAYTL